MPAGARFEMFYQGLEITPWKSLKVIKESPLEKEHAHSQ